MQTASVSDLSKASADANYELWKAAWSKAKRREPINGHAQGEKTVSVKFAHIEDVLTGNMWDGPHGRVFYVTLVMDNGDKGQIGSKTQDKYKIGDALYYKLETGEKGNKLKAASPEEQAAFQANGSSSPVVPFGQQQANPQPTVKNFGGRGSDASFALSYAKDFIGKAMEYQSKSDFRHDADPVSVNQWVEAALVTAAKFNQFLKDNA